MQRVVIEGNRRYHEDPAQQHQPWVIYMYSEPDGGYRLIPRKTATGRDMPTICPRLIAGSKAT